MIVAPLLLLTGGARANNDWHDAEREVVGARQGLVMDEDILSAQKAPCGYGCTAQATIHYSVVQMGQKG